MTQFMLVGVRYLKYNRLRAPLLIQPLPPLGLSDMDPSSQALRRVRDDVIQSRTWSKLQKELMMHMRQMEYRAEEGQLRTFNSLSTREKIATVERAVKEVGKTPTYTKLQSQVVSAIDRHFSPLIYTQVTQQDIATSSSSIHLSPLAHPLAEACSRLLQASPHLKHSLKYALNHPLPPKLRFTAWKILLEYPSVQKDFMLTGKEMRPRSETEREIPQRCETIVNDNPVFRYIAESQTSLLALQAVMLYWKQRTSGTVLDSEILLCIPFIHVWNEELKRHVGEGKGEGWLLFAEIAGEYVHFMEMLPPSIGNAAEVSNGGRLTLSDTLYICSYICSTVQKHVGSGLCIYDAVY